MLKILKNIIIFTVCGFAVFNCVITNNPSVEVDVGVNDNDKDNCMDSRDVPNQKITLKFAWLAGTSIPKQGFIDACERLSDVNVFCTKTDTEEFDIAIRAQYEYENCVRNSDIGFEDGDHPSIIIYSNCVPEDTDKSRWVREVFTFQLSRLFGVVGIPHFCGEGNFNSAVGRGGFKGPYHKELTGDDLVGWENRLRGNSFFGPTGEYKICSPDAIPPICAEIEMFPSSSQQTQIKIKTTEKLKNTVAEGCKILKNILICDIVEEEEEEVEIKIVKAGPAGFSYFDTNSGSSKWIIEIRERNFSEGEEGENDAITKTVVAHEILHTVGVEHYPSWCGTGVMEPHIVAASHCLTLADYAAWQERVDF